MKYIKLFEEEDKPYANLKPYFGDYVICRLSTYMYSSDGYKELREFLPTIIGKVNRYNNNEYAILFNEEDIPEKFRWFFVDHEGTKYNEPYKYTYEKWFKKKDIIEWSKDRNDLEAIFAAKKYNL